MTSLTADHITNLESFVINTLDQCTAVVAEKVHKLPSDHFIATKHRDHVSNRHIFVDAAIINKVLENLDDIVVVKF